MHGQFCWYELTTPDAAASQRFYPKFTSWGTQAFDQDYTMFTSGGVPLAGIFRLTDEMKAQGVPPNWMPYVESDDVDGTATRATSLGGAVVVPPSDIPGTGRFAVLRDPHDAVFGIYKSAVMSGGWDGNPVIGRFSWHELMTTDYQSAFEFYRALFGWEKQGEMDMGGGAMYLMYGKGGRMYGGMYNRLSEMGSMHPFWLVYIHVKDVGKAVDAATKAGGFVLRPRMEIPGGTIAVLGDPQGAGFALHDLTMAALPPMAAAKAKAAVTKVARKAVKAVRKAADSRVARKAVKAVKKAVAKAKKKVPNKAKAPARKKKAAAKPKARTTRRVVRRPARKTARRAKRAKSKK